MTRFPSNRRTVALFLELVCFYSICIGQPVDQVTRSDPVAQGSVAPLGIAPVPHRIQPHRLRLTSSGAGRTTVQISRSVVREPGAAWIRLNFEDYNLERNSFILLTSALDGDQQRLDQSTLRRWGNASGDFRGDAVYVELHAAPGDPEVFINLGSAIVGEHPDGVVAGGCSWDCGICGDDERSRIVHAAIGRLRTPDGSCTAWIVSNGALLTAGHCIGPNFNSSSSRVEFNVPDSGCNGSLSPASLSDQYPVLAGSATWAFGSSMNDWAVFLCDANSNTGLVPVQAQRRFFRMMQLTPSSGIVKAFAAGYGIDQDPPGCTGSANSDNQTLQAGEGVAYRTGDPAGFGLAVTADLTCGASGGAVYLPDASVALGIITVCADTFCSITANGGTGFANRGLSSAVHAVGGDSVVYVDAAHPSPGDGYVTTPFKKVFDAVEAVEHGGVISIVEGVYTAAAGNVFRVGADGKAMTFVAPVGPARIGD